MSVLVANKEVFEAVHKKIWTFQFNKVCDIDYCNTLSLSDNECERFIKELATLNELSYNARYRETDAPILAEFLDLNKGGEKISTLQLLKYLQCIDYNIEVSTILNGYDSSNAMTEDEKRKFKFEYGNTLELLERSINELQNSIISHLTDYKKLKWSEA